MDVDRRARIHQALADPHRLRMVDALRLTDLTPRELRAIADIPSNLLAHHLRVLEEAGVVERHGSEGDRRRRYVTLRTDVLDALVESHLLAPGTVVFICTHNSARSQFAAALWNRHTGGTADSAGNQPATRIHPMAVKAAAAVGVELRGTPKPYDAITQEPALVVSVCDRAHEDAPPFNAPLLHWSVPDPVSDGRQAAFRAAFTDITRRVERLAAAMPPPPSHPEESWPSPSSPSPRSSASRSARARSA